jgi:hypothetical protein
MARTAMRALQRNASRSANFPSVNATTSRRKRPAKNFRLGIASSVVADKRPKLKLLIRPCCIKITRLQYRQAMLRQTLQYLIVMTAVFTWALTSGAFA